MSYLLIYQKRRRENLKRLLTGYATQRDFADVVGLSVAQVSHIVTGVREMGEEIARRIEQSLGLEMGWMDREMEPSNVQAGVTASPEALRVALAIQSLPAKDRASLQKIVDALAQQTQLNDQDCVNG